MITGILYKIFPAETHRDFISRIFWVQEQGVKYPQMWELVMWHDDVYDLESFKEKDVVECDFLPKGRIYETPGRERKVKTTLQCTEIRKI